jgi:3-methyladenine DNA glycosylase/8-oxoguanine DNA glycosylase
VHAEPWRPHRGLAARLLWTNLFDRGDGGAG